MVRRKKAKKARDVKSRVFCFPPLSARKAARISPTPGFPARCAAAP
nr:MAG TPA: hypothetical protein [Caudoviricetes sp.]